MAKRISSTIGKLGRGQNSQYQVIIDTTAMDQIIRNTDDPHTYIIGDGVEYGAYVEYGTSKMPGRAFLIPAYKNITDPLPKAVRQAIERFIPLDKILAKAAFDILGEAQRNTPVGTGALRNSLHVEIE